MNFLKLFKKTITNFNECVFIYNIWNLNILILKGGCVLSIETREKEYLFTFKLELLKITKFNILLL